MSRSPSPLLLAAALLAAAAFAPDASGAVARVAALPLSDGTVVPAHVAGAGDLSDREAARRRAELLKSPYSQPGEKRALLGGEVVAVFEAAVPAELRESAVRAAERTVREVLDRDGWARPLSASSPLTLLLVHLSPGVPVLVGWDGREKGRLARPVLAVGTAGRDAGSVAFDVARGISLLAVRQAGPDEAGWAVEGLSSHLAREALGLSAPPVVGASPFLLPRGTLADPAAAALFLAEAARTSAGGRAGLRAAWDEAGIVRGDDGEAFFRAVAARAGEEGAEGLLARLVADAVASAPEPAAAGASRALSPGELPLTAPEPLGWARVTFERLDERAGLEVALPESRAARGARAVLVYRPASGEPDTLPLAPGTTRTLPLAGAGALSLVFVDGTEAGDVPVGLRRVPGYPAVLAATGAEWRDGALQVSWRTSSHADLLAWVVTRYREGIDGSLALDGREIVPTTDASEEGSGFQLVDREALPGRRYVYRVSALTLDGLLSEAFEAAAETDPAD